MIGGGPGGNGGGITNGIGGGTCATSTAWLANIDDTDTSIVKYFIEATSFFLATF